MGSADIGYRCGEEEAQESVDSNFSSCQRLCASITCLCHPLRVAVHSVPRVTIPRAMSRYPVIHHIYSLAVILPS